MWDFLKRFMGYSTKTEPVAPYKVEAPVKQVDAIINSDTDAPTWLKEADAAEVLAKASPSKCGCGRSPSGYCVGLHKLSDAAWAAKQAADAPIPAPVEPVVAVEKPKKVAKPKAVKATPAITAKPKAAPKAKTPKK